MKKNSIIKKTGGLWLGAVVLLAAVPSLCAQSDGTRILTVGCANESVTALDAGGCYSLRTLNVERNRLPLSAVSAIQRQMNAPREGDYHYSYTPQTIPVSLQSGQTFNLGAELALNGVETQVDFGTIASAHYTFTDGKLKFKRSGTYRLRLWNETVRNAGYYDAPDGMEDDAVVEVFYDFTVKTDDPTPSDPTPSDPTPSGPTANEAVAAALPFAYVQGRTVYLSDGLGEVEAFTAVGQCVYRGFDRTIAVLQPGVYILRVAADGRRCKVIVR